jgi:hypothetical protein
MDAVLAASDPWWSSVPPPDPMIVTYGQLQDRTVNTVPNPLDFQAEHLGQ